MYCIVENDKEILRNEDYDYVSLEFRNLLNSKRDSYSFMGRVDNIQSEGGDSEEVAVPLKISQAWMKHNRDATVVRMEHIRFESSSTVSPQQLARINRSVRGL